MYSTILIVFFIFTFSSAVDFQNCGSIYDLQAVDIEGCYETPCDVISGEQINVTVTFKAKQHHSQKLSQYVYFVLQKLEVPAKATPEPCNAFSCPIYTGSQRDSLVRVNVVDYPLPTKSTLGWEIENEKGAVVICFKVPVYFRLSNTYNGNITDHR